MTARHVLIVGGGYVGLYTALRLQRNLRGELKRREVKITIVDPQSYMTYQPFLPEAAAGNLNPRDVVVPLRRVLPKVDLLNGRVAAVHHAQRRATVVTVTGEEREIDYDVLVMAAGSMSRTLPIPGLAENGIGFKTIAEAIKMRNHILKRLDMAQSTTDPVLRRKLLTFVVVGGGFAGVEALAEMEDMARNAVGSYPALTPYDMRWVMVEASDRILPEVGDQLGWYALDQLRARGVEVKLQTRLESAENKHIVLSDGDEFDTDTLVWTAGVKATPIPGDLPVDERGRIRATTRLTIEGLEGAFTAGDIAAVPDLAEGPGTYTAPNAQHAVRQAKVLAENVERHLAGLATPQLAEYRHKSLGSLAGLGLHKGASIVYGVKVRGFMAWFLHRTYHLSQVPTLNRKVRVVADWTLALFFRREIVSLGQMERPHEEFLRAVSYDRERAA